MKNENNPKLLDGETRRWNLLWQIPFFTLEASVLAAIGVGILYVYIYWQTGLFGLIGLLLLFVIARKAFAILAVNEKFFGAHTKLYAITQGVDVGLAWLQRQLGIIHGLHGRFIVWGTKKFTDLPLKTKLIVGGAAAVILLSMSFFTVKTSYTAIINLPYGPNRDQMTAEELARRVNNRINTARFAVWGKDNAAAEAKQMDDRYHKLIWDSAAKNGISPERFEGLLFVESFGDKDAVVKSSGAAGIAMIKVDVGCEQGLILNKQFCDTVTSKTTIVPPGIEDRRFDPQYAIPAAAAILGASSKYWGNENWAFVEYHMGMGNLHNLVVNYLNETSQGWRSAYPPLSPKADPVRDPAKPKELARQGITYDDIFFRCTPGKTPKTYKTLFGLADSSGTYVYTGLAAADGFIQMRQNNKAFLAMVQEQRDPDGGTANRLMRAWWSNKEARYNSRSDINAAVANRELFAVPDRKDLGYALRTTGSSRIAQCDPGHEESYYFTKKANAGLIFLMMSRIKDSGADQLPEITGLIRTNDMYDKLKCLPNTQPRTHVIGAAFDIGLLIKGKPKSAATKRAMEFVIMDLRADGIIDRIKEGSADHIAYNPAFEQELEAVYDRVMSGGSPLTHPIMEPLLALNR